MKLIIINGPNLNLLGTREKEIYGESDFETYLKKLQKDYSSLQIDYYQSNVEGELINKIHETGFSYNGIILNAGAYTHASIAISDAIAAVTTPVVEVHITNIYKREEYRHKSIISAHCVGMISGLGLESYQLAISYFNDK